MDTSAILAADSRVCHHHDSHLMFNLRLYYPDNDGVWSMSVYLAFRLMNPLSCQQTEHGVSYMTST